MYYFIGIVLIGIIAWLIFKDKPVIFVDKQKFRQLQITGYLKKNGEITNKQYRTMVDISDATATRDLDELEKRGVVEQIGKVGKYVKYRLKK